ncbi:PD-(D/E)XK nuclease family protein [Croceimicrobium sp.]|uniref:PD-(D/E)XK nuclease family protein n=1 Tax=Croceimicrobium sp. TaxID=2828340 RepID=UPI003BA8A6E4
MSSFLDQVAQFLLNQPLPLHRQTVVLPSRRAGIFLQRALESQLEKARLAPRLLSIEEFIFELTALEPVSRPELYFRLFECLRNSVRPDLKFEEFNRWGRALLQDFNEIDRYLIEPDQIFSYLGDLKRIEQWNLEPGEHTRMLDDYLKFWPALADVYKELKQSLLAESKAWQGLAYRVFAEKIEFETAAIAKEYEQFYFIGFNALNNAEEKALMHLYEAGLAQFFWDVDRYYFDDSEQEAGHFLRNSPLVKRLQKHDSFYGLHDALAHGTRKVESIAIAGSNLQSIVASNLLSEQSEEDLAHTAMVLSDEALLPAFLNNIHPQFPSLNLSMGLGLQHSPLAGFFEILLDFPLEAERNGKKNGKGWARFHFKRWEALLNHPITHKIAGSSAYQLQEIRAEMHRKNALYASLPDLELEKLLAPLSADFFKADQSQAAQYQRLAEFCETSLNLLVDQSSLQEGLFAFYQLFKQTADTLNRFPYLENFEQSLQFYRELLPDLGIDLRGEPLQGMQVMGWLETRCLDFKQIVVLSLNEGVLPKGRSESSLLPFDVKRKFGLPTYLEKDAVFAYHFYRLMQRAQKIYLLHSTSTSGIGVVEPSRFVRQLELEWPQKNARLQFINQIATARSQEGKAKEQVLKSPALMQRLDEMAERGFSPSSLYLYLKDPLQFYYEKVLGLKPDESLMEELDLPAQGNVLHEFLEFGFSQPKPEDPDTRIPYTPDPDGPFFKADLNQLKSELRNLMLKHVPGLPLDQGPNLLHLESMSFMLRNFLKFESARLKKLGTTWQVLATEKGLEGQIKLASGRQINLIGNADRIDQEGNRIHIIDYKSGAKSKYDYSISTLEFEAFVKKPQAIQLPMYALMYWQQNPELKIQASVLSLRKLSDNPFTMKMEKSAFLDAENQEAIVSVLQAIFEEMFNPDIPFQSRA